MKMGFPSNIDQNRLARQEIGGSKWRRNNGQGTLEYPTGVGKTFVAVHIIMKRMLIKDPTRTFLVVVPRIPLKLQWERELKAAGIINCTVVVINGLVLQNTRIICDLLVLDEIHRYAAPVFKRVFDLVEYKYILGLTATLERLDFKHKLLEAHCPIVDTITPEEARYHNWVAKYEEYALKIKMTHADKQEYERLNDMFYRYFGRFNQDFDLAMSCLTNKQARLDYAYNQGWDSRRFDDTYMWSPKNIQKYAVLFSRSMHKRKQFLYNLGQKVDVIKEIAKRNPVKTIMFSESTGFADTVKAYLGNQRAITYHSSVPSEVETYTKVTKYKTKPDKKEIKTRKIGRKRVLAKSLARFKDNRSNVRFLATAKALDEGFDAPDIECAIIASYTSNPTQQIQRRGRAVRKWTFKDGTEKRPIIIYLYTEGTQEESWLKKSLKHTGVKYIESVDEIFEPEVQLFSSASDNAERGSSPGID